MYVLYCTIPESLEVTLFEMVFGYLSLRGPRQKLFSSLFTGFSIPDICRDMASRRLVVAFPFYETGSIWSVLHPSVSYVETISL